MNLAIGSIVSSDEAAKAIVERAERDTALLITAAEDKAKNMLTALELQIEETEQYIERLRQFSLCHKAAPLVSPMHTATLWALSCHQSSP